MSNILDYLDWRGDLTVKQDGFHTVDSLILSTLSYIEFEKIESEIKLQEGVTIAEAGERFMRLHADKKVSAGRLIPDAVFDLLDVLSRCDRFKNMIISNYVNQIDEIEEKQFSAMTVELGDGSIYIAFRGTDDTLIGWKEDFNMSFKSPVPSQLQAVEYLKRIAAGKRGRIRMGGHSKGGNIAVYAAVFSPIRIGRRILSVDNFDGPGFTREILEKMESRMEGQVIRTIVPQSSVIGMLLEHEEVYDVVASTQVGIFQHDPFSWQVQGKQFILVDDISASTYKLDDTLRSFILSMDKEGKAEFVDTLFYVLMECGARTLSDLTLKDTIAIFKRLNKEDKESKKVLQQAFHLLLQTAQERSASERRLKNNNGR